MIVETGVAHDVSAQRLLRGTGLSLDDLHDGESLLEAGQELAIARNLIGCAGDRPGLGVDAGLRYTVASAGILGFALLASPTVRAAITVALRYVALSSAFVRLSLEENDTEGRIVFADDEIPADVRAFLFDRDLAATMQIAPLLVGDLNQASVRAELRVDRARGQPLGGALAGVSVKFGMPENAIVFARRVLDQSLASADAHTADMCERQCREMLQRRQRRHGMAATVRSRLLRDPADQPSMQAVAQQLHVDPRTLRRHLEREGTSFRALVTEVRETLAIELLSNTGLTVDEVATRLGYSETASFTHAFKRWRGAPPSHFRRRA
ncbi:AraC family transcriptional regulator [Paraconexibacter antarcticus]|uniref:AraC family transcriptional regulator n=1 Tax=Paraconexibacter antarcticus TaxID=2949664 RepID=A0ABY5DZI3_9ACTN|nr:AraC family transcriptional regulator [Paraconexibacter antarcticus]UTI66247.1 AraC family transcriptional regulator [Paraconexibacter antarcticus]